MTEQEAIRPHHRPWRLQRVRSQCRGANGIFVSSSVGRFYRSFRHRSSRDHYAPMVVGFSTSQIKLDSGSSATTGPRLAGPDWISSSWGASCGPGVGPVDMRPGAFQRVSLLVGPSGETPVDTEYYQRQVRGRLAGRKANDLILQFPVGAARVQPDWGQGTRIDRHALWVKPGSPWRYRPHPPRGAGEM